MQLEPLYALLLNTNASVLVEQSRAQLIISRVRTICMVYAILTPALIPLDMVLFPTILWRELWILRVCASLAFVLLYYAAKHAKGLSSAYGVLGSMLVIPGLFYLISQPILARVEIHGQFAQTLATIYGMLPFVLNAGISLFPLSIVESGIISLVLWGSNLWIFYSGTMMLSVPTHLGILWLLALFSVIASLSALIQLQFLQAIIEQSARDSLTQAYTRKMGEELLNIYYPLACRENQAFTIAFVDLDHFKTINDTFGHEAGDEMLKSATDALRQVLRQTDLLIRWGGEEFVVVMPSTDLKSALVPLTRLMELGLGLRPDGVRMTASIGVCERSQSHQDWHSLINCADALMYQAKQGGRNQLVQG